MSIHICFYLFLLKCLYCSHFCCFIAPIAMSNSDDTLIKVDHTQLKYQKKSVNIVKMSLLNYMPPAPYVPSYLTRLRRLIHAPYPRTLRALIVHF